jgi:hypothetical protein
VISKGAVKEQKRSQILLFASMYREQTNQTVLSTLSSLFRFLSRPVGLGYADKILDDKEDLNTTEECALPRPD